MPLIDKVYDSENYGEWYPWGTATSRNYSNIYPTAIKLLHSTSAQANLVSNIELGTKVNTQLPPSSIEASIKIWPDNLTLNVTTYSDGTTIFRYKVNDNSIQIEIMKPPPLNSDDRDKFELYKDSLQRLFERNITDYLDFGDVLDENGLNRDVSNSRYFVETSFVDDPGPLTIIDDTDKYSITVSNFRLILSTDVPFTTNNTFVEGGTIEWLPFEHQITEDEIESDWLVSSAGKFAEEGQYIKLQKPGSQPAGSNADRIFQVGRYVELSNPDTSISGHTEVISVDGTPLSDETPINYDIKNVSMRPKLRIRYRIPAPDGRSTPSDPPSRIFKFSMKENTSNSWGYHNFNSSGTVRTALWEHDPDNDPDQSFFDKSSPHANAIITGLGGIRQNNWGMWHTGIQDGPLATGFNAIELNTTNVTAEGPDKEKRITPWRKAYRFINRFKFNGALISCFHQAGGGFPNAEGKAFFNMKYDIVSGPQPAGGESGIEYPLSCIHRPPCLYAQLPDDSGIGNGHITLGHSITDSSLESGDWWEEDNRDYDGNGVTDPSWNRVSAKYYIEPDGYGWQLKEQNNPDTISFTLNLSDAGSRSGLGDYDFTDSISCKDIVTPAYSGETLYRDFKNQTQGFMVNNYVKGSSPVDAIFIDISQTDEILRMSGSGGSTPNAMAELWKDTFDSITVRNKSKNEFKTFDSSSIMHRITEDVDGNALDTKENFVVAICSTESTTWLSNWATEDEIEVKFNSKKVIQSWEDPNLSLDTATYVPIEYRDLADEYKDDIRSEFTDVAGNINDFTITSDGEVDGNITIVIDGDIPSNIKLRYEERLD